MVRTSFRIAAAAALLFPTICAGDDPPEDCNAKVLAYARSKVGEQVGNGQCSELAREALREAGARPKFPSSPDEGFAWGDPVASLKEARPGDLVTFEKVSFRGRRRILGEDGFPRISITTQIFPHHVAVVAEVGPKAKWFTILHQNVGQADGTFDQKVQEARLVLAEMRKGGSMEFFRPVPR